MGEGCLIHRATARVTSSSTHPVPLVGVRACASGSDTASLQHASIIMNLIGWREGANSNDHYIFITAHSKLTSSKLVSQNLVICTDIRSMELTDL